MSINPANSASLPASYAGNQDASAQNTPPEPSPEEMKERLVVLREEQSKLCLEVDGGYGTRFAFEPEMTASIRESLGQKPPGKWWNFFRKAVPLTLGIATAGAAVSTGFIVAGLGGIVTYALSRHVFKAIQEKKDLKVDALLYPRVEEKYGKVNEEIYRIERKLSGDEKNENEWNACSTGTGLQGDIAAGKDMTAKGISRALTSRITPENLWRYRPDGYNCTLDTPPAVSADGTVCTVTQGGRLIAVKDGNKLWELDTGQHFLAPPAVGPDGMVYAYTEEGKLIAAKDGRTCWELDTGEQSSYAAPLVAPDGTVYTGGHKGKLTGVKDGKKVWEYDAGGFIQTPFLLGDGTMVVGNSQKVLAFRDGKKAWEFDDNSSGSTIPVPGPDGSVLVMGNDCRLHAVKEGKSLWAIKIDMRNNPCTGPDGMVYVSTYEHSKSCITAIKDGNIAWEVRLVGGYVASSPSVSPDNTVYAQNGTNTLFALKEGKKLWKAHIGVKPQTMGNLRIAETAYGTMTPPVPGPDNIVYVNNCSRIYAVKDHMAASGEALSGDDAKAAGLEINDEDGWLSIDGVKLSINDPGEKKPRR